MDVHVLGPLELRVAGRPVTLGAAKARALLVMLALDAGRAVPIDRLAEGLWGEAVPASAHKMVQQYVSQLRRALDGDPAEIITRGRGYELQLGGTSDVAQFEALLAEGAAREALALWRGPALTDLADEPFAAAEIRRLDELRLRGHEEAIEEGLDAGRHRELLHELDELVTAHPLSERLHAQRMLALYRSGRQAEALQAFREARVHLVNEVGIEPGPELRALHERILQQDPELDVAPAPPAPAPRPAAAALTSPTAPPRAPRRRRRAALAALVAGLAVFGADRIGDRGVQRIGADGVGRLDDDGKIAARYAVGRVPGAVVAGGGSLWVASERDRTVTRIDRGRDRVVTIPVNAEPVDLAFAGGSLWVADGSRGRVVRVDPGTDRAVQEFELPNVARAVTATGGSVWVASAVGGGITRIDLERGTVAAMQRVGGSPNALAAGDGALWAASESDSVVTQIDARSGAAVRTIPVPGAPSAIAFGAGGVWMANRGDDTVSRIDPAKGTVTDTVEVGRAPSAIAVGEDAVWVANSQDGTLTRLDPRTREVTRTVEVGGGPAGLAFEGEALWATAGVDVAGHRGGTLRFGGIEPQTDTALHPASPDSNNMESLAVQSVLYDGLVAYRRVGGTAGAQIVADLAESVPRPTDEGREYAFRLRPGLKYSDGTAVRATDFRASMNRLQKVNDEAAGALAGIDRIDVDDAARTIVVRLRDPDPELLHKLALPSAAVLPKAGGGAADQAPPGTGPYRVKSPHLLVRNPHFRSWSRDARPPAFVDEILLQSSERSDVRIDFVPQDPDQLRTLTTRFGGRLRVDPILLSQWLFMNTKEPPFDDVRVRRAVNFAVDRERIIELLGGDEAGQLTCRIIPAGLPGHRPVCPFTRDASAAGGWRGPDLERARRLIGDSGVTGARVSLYAPQLFGPLGDYFRNLLSDLGFRVTYREFEDDGEFFESMFKDRPKAGLIAWIGDTLAPSGFVVPSFACDGDINLSGLCDRELETLIERAREGRESDALWDRVEHRLAELAPAVPFLHGRRLTVLGDRAGNFQSHPMWGPMLDQIWVR